jgi:hypothetical protein
MRRTVRRRHAQALVEAAVVAPLLVLLVLVAIGVGRLVQARMALDAVTREAARAAVLSPMPRVGSNGESAWRAARENGRNQGEAVARGFGWNNVQLDLDADPSFQPGNWVSAEGQVAVETIHLPFMQRVFGEGSGAPVVTLRSQHWERIDPYRSLLP